MSDLERIADMIFSKINEDGDATPGMVGVAKTTGSPSVEYLPGNFTHMRNVLNSLSTVKNKWKLDVLEKNDKYHVMFEDAFNVIVPKFAYAEFNAKVLPVIGVTEADLTGIINEARSAEIHGLYDRLAHVLTIDLRENRQIKRTLVLMNYWLTVFKNSKFLPMSGQVAIQLNTYDKSIRELVDRIQNIHSDDVGNLEMLIKTIQDDRPLNAFEPFAEYDYLVGCRIQSEHGGAVLILELTVNLGMVATQSIYIESQDVLDELEGYRTVKVLKDMAFPVGEMFQPSIFNNIRDIIDGETGA